MRRNLTKPDGFIDSVLFTAIALAAGCVVGRVVLDSATPEERPLPVQPPAERARLGLIHATVKQERLNERIADLEASTGALGTSFYSCVETLTACEQRLVAAGIIGTGPPR